VTNPCERDIATQPSQAASAFSVLEAIAKQVEAIWQAQQKKGEGRKKAPEGGAK